MENDDADDAVVVVVDACGRCLKFYKKGMNERAKIGIWYEWLVADLKQSQNVCREE